MITRGEPTHLKECLDSVAKHVDEICLTYTGPETDDAVSTIQEWGKAHYYGKLKLSFYNQKSNPEAFFENGDIYSFCKAREFNFKQATGDWILWLDSDDVLRYPERLASLVDIADKNAIDGFFFRYWYLTDGEKWKERHWKLQFVRREAPMEWKGNVHEDYLPQGQVRLAKIEDIIRIHKNGDVSGKTSSKRNINILVRDLQEQGDNPDPRTLFYLARAFLVDGNHVEAIPLLEKYSELSGWPEELCEALYLLADCYLRIGEHKKAVQTCLGAIEVRPDFPDCYFLLGRIYLNLQEWKKAEVWLRKGFSNPIPEDELTHFPNRYTFEPLAALAVALLNQGQAEKALQAANEALKYDPANKEVNQLRDVIEFTRKRQEVAKGYVKVAGYLHERGMDWKIPTLLGTAPEDMSADPLLSQIRSQWCPPKKWADKSVAILAFGAVEAWSPKNEKEGGIGGSEEAVLNLSRSLAARGYDVTVYTNTGPDDGDYEGVHWKMFTEFNPRDEFDTLVIWRQPTLADTKFNAKTVLFDMHDVPFYGDWTEKRLANVDKIMVKSQYHRSLLPDVPDEKIVVVGNGINLSHFKGTQTRQANRCIYSSAIDRGLDILLEKIWPAIHAKVPDGELHVYYGFKTYEELNKGNPERMAYMEKIKKLLETTPGVVYHGRVDHETLAKEFKKSDVWLYPTYFPEIHCITALKAQMGGAIPVTTDYAALDETVQNGVKVHGDIYLPEIQEEFVTQAVALLTDHNRKDSIRQTIQEWPRKNSWDEVANVWEKSMTKSANE